MSDVIKAVGTLVGNNTITINRLRLMIRCSVSEFEQLFPIQKVISSHEQGQEEFFNLRGKVAVIGTQAWIYLRLPKVPTFHCFDTGKALYLLLPVPLKSANTTLAQRAEHVRLAWMLRHVKSRYEVVDSTR